MPKKLKSVRIEGDFAYVPLTQGYEAIIDLPDLPLVEGYNWYAWVCRRTVYAQRNVTASGGKKTTIKMHRRITGAPSGVPVDHRDHNGLNNTRSNLRICTHQQNVHNRQLNCRSPSGFKGVHWHEKTQKWRAQIGFNGKKYHLGLYNDPEEAHKAYCEASAKYHKEYGHTGEV